MTAKKSFKPKMIRAKTRKSIPGQSTNVREYIREFDMLNSLVRGGTVINGERV